MPTKRRMPRRKNAPKRAKRIKRLSINDPALLNIPPAFTPAGMSYQWIAVSIHGKAWARPLMEAEKVGWRPVPFARLKDWFPRTARDANGDINIGGLLLIENSTANVALALSKLSGLAKQQMQDVADRLKIDTHRNGPQIFAGMLPQSDVVAIPFTVPDEITQDVEITITLRAPYQLHETAAAMKISIEEYLRRRLIMEPGVLYPIMEPGFVRQSERTDIPAYDFWPFPFNLKKEDR